MRKGLIAAAVAIGALAVSASGCTAQPDITASVAAQESTPPTTTPEEAVDLPITMPIDEAVLGKLENQHGTGQLGPFQRKSDRLAVYFNCVGAGSATITIDGVGNFPTSCDPASGTPSIRNTFDIRYVDSFSIKVDALDNVTWSLGAAETT